MDVSAYTKDDKIVEGKLEVLPNGQKMVLTESGKIKLDELKYVRFIEEEENQVDKQVNSDISVLKKGLEKNKPDEKTLEDAAEKREKELKDAGLKGEPDEYKTKFVLQAAAIVNGADSGMDMSKADANGSDAFKGIKESKELPKYLEKYGKSHFSELVDAMNCKNPDEELHLDTDEEKDVFEEIKSLWNDITEDNYKGILKKISDLGKKAGSNDALFQITPYAYKAVCKEDDEEPKEEKDSEENKETVEVENKKPEKTKGPYIDDDLEPLKQKLETHSDDGWHDFCVAKVFDDLIKGNNEKLDFFNFWNWVADTGNKDLAELVSHDFDEGNLGKDSHTADFYKMYSDFKDQALSDPEGFKKEYGWIIKDNKNVPKSLKKEIKELEESEDVNNETELHPDYQTAVPYQDNLTRDQIYLKMKQEIDNYKQDDNNNFDEKELVERMYKKFAGVRCLREQTLKESFKSIRILAILREMTAQKFVKAVKDGDLKRVRNSFIKLHDQTFPDGTRKEEYDPKDTLAFVDEVVTKLKEDGYSSAQIVEILGNWFGIGGTYEFDMNVIKKIIEDREEHDSILDAHPDWFPVNKENVWNNGTDVQKEFA